MKLVLMIQKCYNYSDVKKNVMSFYTCWAVKHFFTGAILIRPN